MNIYPAIDLKNGQCVRLLKGDMHKATIFSDSPATQAKEFEDAGFSWLHLVDLDGACAGQAVNHEAVTSILQAVNIPVQLGGGIRTIEDVARWLEAGISRVILGTVAVKNPALVRAACKLFPDKIAVGIDALGGMVATEGWVEASEVSAVDLAKQFEDAGVAAIIYTDINRDGAMQGANIEETAALAQSISTPVILSGGVSTLADLQRIKAHKDSGIEGAIIGRALYEKTISYAEALSA